MRRYLAVAVFWSGCQGLLQAQGMATVQLPSFRQFSMGTTVLVPDRGGIQVGGLDRSWHRSTRRGAPFLPGGARSFGGGAASTGVSVHAYIHDLAEMDEAILREWHKVKSSSSVKSSSIAKEQFAGVASPSGIPHRPPTIRQQRAQLAAAEAARQAQAVADFQAGWQLEQQGKTGAARVYYGMALKQAAGELRDQIASRLSALGSARVARR